MCGGGVRARCALPQGASLWVRAATNQTPPPPPRTRPQTIDQAAPGEVPIPQKVLAPAFAMASGPGAAAAAHTSGNGASPLASADAAAVAAAAAAIVGAGAAVVAGQDEFEEAEVKSALQSHFD